jgi:hypothetical protein
MNFSAALELIKAGHKLRREEWEQYDMHLALHEGRLRCFSQKLPLDELCLGGSDLLATDWETLL